MTATLPDVPTHYLNYPARPDGRSVDFVHGPDGDPKVYGPDTRGQFWLALTQETDKTGTRVGFAPVDLEELLHG